MNESGMVGVGGETKRRRERQRQIVESRQGLELLGNALGVSRPANVLSTGETTACEA